MNINPFWQINPKNTGLVLEQVQLFLWAKGICVAGHDSEGKLLAARAYQSEEVYDPTLLEHVILNEPLLADAEPVRKVWMGVSRHLIFPESLTDIDTCDPWFEKFYFQEHDEELATSSAPEHNIRIIYPKKKQLRSMLGQYFPNRKSRFVIAPKPTLDWFSQNSTYRMVVLMMGDCCSLTFFEKERLMHFVLLDLPAAEDIVSYAGNYWKNLPNIDIIEVAVAGLSAQVESMQNQLGNYLTQIRPTPDSTMLLEILAQCE